jgi:hypothetical protein
MNPKKARAKRLPASDLGKAHRRCLNGKSLPPGDIETKGICSGGNASEQDFQIPFHACYDSNSNPEQLILG